MDSRATLTAPSARPVQLPLVALLGVILVLAAVGGYLAAGVLGAGGHAAPPQQREPKDGFAVGDSVFTSFGAVAVEAVEKGAGPSAKALSGVTHGIQNLIPPNKAQIQAFATMTNLSARPVHYDPRQFSLIVGRKDARPQGLFGASVKAGTLQPNAAIDVRLSFVVPRKGQKLWVRFSDPARKAPFLIDLGRVSKAPRGALSNHHRHPSR